MHTLPYHKLCLGLDEQSPVDELLSLGIRQFFVGYLTQAWIEKYATQLSLNRRYRAKEQFLDFERLRATVKQVQQGDGEVFFALNAPSYNTQTIDDARAMVALAKELGMDGIIVGSLSLLLHLKTIGYDKIVISNLLGCYSAEAVQFFVEQFSPYKVVLPRDLRHEEIAEIVQQHPATRFEVFLFGDHCRLSEANCFVEHGYDSVISQDLCSYALKKKIFHSRARPDFKSICLNDHLTTSEKVRKLTSRRYHLGDMLDLLDETLLKGEIKEMAEILDEMGKIDMQWSVQEQPKLLYRAINTLRRIEMPKAGELCQLLEAEVSDSAVDVNQHSYAAFHRIDREAIAEAVTFFSQFDNIVSYKIPTRGRDALKRVGDACNGETNSGCGSCSAGKAV